MILASILKDQVFLVYVAVLAAINDAFCYKRWHCVDWMVEYRLKHYFFKSVEVDLLVE